MLVEVFWHPRRVPVEMFWARGDPKADQGHAAGLVAFICLDLAEENKAMLISQPVGVNDV